MLPTPANLLSRSGDKISTMDSILFSLRKETPKEEVG